MTTMQLITVFSFLRSVTFDDVFYFILPLSQMSEHFIITIYIIFIFITLSTIFYHYRYNN